MNNDLSILKRRFFPSFYTHDAPRLIEFFGYYLEWMEQKENPYWTVCNLDDFTSIDGSIDIYFDHLKNELMIDFPKEYAADIRYIMKQLVMLYQSKGTIDSLKFFFRALYNSFCEVSYPRENILKASDGKWVQGYYVYTEDIEVTELNKLLGKTIIEVQTGITGLVNSTIPHYFEGDDKIKYALVITNNIKSFTEGNTFREYGTEDEYRIVKAEYSEGYWDGTDGFISADKIIQDGYYYQNFSYEITSLISIEEYKDIVERLLHPAGLKMFGRVQLAESVEPITKTPVTFLRWWIIKTFMHMLAQEKRFLAKSCVIKNNPDVYTFAWTADQQYYNKQYGIVERVKTMTPNQLYNATNDSNKLVFVDGYLIEPEWSNYKLNITTMHYNIAGIYSEYPVIKTICKNGVITLLKDQKVSDVVFIFIDGIKMRDAYITKTTTGFKLATNISGNAIIYSLRNIITRVIKKTINNNTISFKASEKRRILPFIDGEFMWDTLKYDNNVITIPHNTGYLELYELQNNENLFVKHYFVKGNNTNTLYCNNLLKNIF